MRLTVNGEVRPVIVAAIKVYSLVGAVVSALGLATLLLVLAGVIR